MSNISDYIKSSKKLKSLDFLTVYLTIIELIKDGKIELKNKKIFLPLRKGWFFIAKKKL